MSPEPLMLRNQQALPKIIVSVHFLEKPVRNLTMFTTVPTYIWVNYEKLRKFLPCLSLIQTDHLKPT
jgi:hypothetical protein